MPPPSLAQRHDLAAVRAALLPRDQWHRFPAANDRAAWEQLSGDTRRQLIATGEARAAEDWEHLTATLILDFKRKGDRRSYQDPHFRRRTRLQDLVLAECAEGRGRFMDAIADNVWLTCEETFWGWPAHLDEQKVGRELPDIAEPIVDLGVGESAALLAWVDHLLGPQLDTVSPLIRRRIRHEVDRRVLTPCLERDNFWWMGWERRHHPVNNWNPWVNSNWLACVLLLEADEDRRARAVHKIMRSLDVFIAHQPEDGGCDEGPGYWDRAGGSLFDCLELLHSATAGKIDLFHEPLIAEMGRFIMRAHLTGDWYVNFADATARPTINAELVQRYGRAIGDQELVAFGKWAQQHQSDRPTAMIRSLNRTLAALLDPVPGEAQVTPTPTNIWLPHLQFAIMRSPRLIIGAKGGHNQESHNHNDVGSFLACLDGSPLLIDVGVESYTAKTFSPQRYEIWTMQSQWHNLPTINGTMQQAGRDFAARDVRMTDDGAGTVFSLDLAGAYPPAANTGRWTRSLRLEQPGVLTLTDDYELKGSSTPTVWNFITPRRPGIATDGKVHLQSIGGTEAVLAYAAGTYHAEVDEVKITDGNLHKVWGDFVYRLRVTELTPAAKAKREFVFTPAKA